MNKIEEIKKILNDPANWARQTYSVGDMDAPIECENYYLLIDKVSKQICQAFESKPETSILIIKGTEHPEERIPLYKPRPDESRFLTDEEITVICLAHHIFRDRLNGKIELSRKIAKAQRDLTVAIKEAEFKEVCANCAPPLLLESKIRKAVTQTKTVARWE